MWSPLNEEQREFLADHFTLQNYKKNEVIHCEGETPTLERSKFIRTA